MSHAPEAPKESHAPAPQAEHAEVHDDMPWYRKIAKSVWSAVKKVYQVVIGNFFDGVREGWREENPLRVATAAPAAAAHGGGGH